MHTVLARKPEGKRPLGRPKHRWDDNISMKIKEMGFEDVDWIHLSQDRVQWLARVHTVVRDSIKGGEFLD
jgi:hypothetical protein